MGPSHDTKVPAGGSAGDDKKDTPPLELDDKLKNVAAKFMAQVRHNNDAVELLKWKENAKDNLRVHNRYSLAGPDFSNAMEKAREGISKLFREAKLAPDTKDMNFALQNLQISLNTQYAKLTLGGFDVTECQKKFNEAKDAICKNLGADEKKAVEKQLNDVKEAFSKKLQDDQVSIKRQEENVRTSALLDEFDAKRQFKYKFHNVDEEGAPSKNTLAAETGDKLDEWYEKLRDQKKGILEDKVDHTLIHFSKNEKGDINFNIKVIEYKNIDKTIDRLTTLAMAASGSKELTISFDKVEDVSLKQVESFLANCKKKNCHANLSPAIYEKLAKDLKQQGKFLKLLAECNENYKNNRKSPDDAAWQKIEDKSGNSKEVQEIVDKNNQRQLDAAKGSVDKTYKHIEEFPLDVKVVNKAALSNIVSELDKQIKQAEAELGRLQQEKSTMPRAIDAKDAKDEHAISIDKQIQTLKDQVLQINNSVASLAALTAHYNNDSKESNVNTAELKKTQGKLNALVARVDAIDPGKNVKASADAAIRAAPEVLVKKIADAKKPEAAKPKVEAEAKAVADVRSTAAKYKM